MTDTVAGLLQLVGVEGVKWQLLNIGSKEETRITDLAGKIIDLSQSRSKTGFRPLPPGDHRRRLPELGRAKKTIEWNPRLGLGEGLERTYRWLSNRNLSYA